LPIDYVVRCTPVLVGRAWRACRDDISNEDFIYYYTRNIDTLTVIAYSYRM